MKTLLVCFCSLMMVIMFVSCQTADKAPPEAGKPKAPPETSEPNTTSEVRKAEKPSVPGSINLTGKWKFRNNFDNTYSIGTNTGYFEMVQKGTEITWTGFPIGGKINIGTLKGNILHMEPVNYFSRQSRIFCPAREYIISQDGNTMTSKYKYEWDYSWAGGDGDANVTCTRE